MTNANPNIRPVSPDQDHYVQASMRAYEAGDGLAQARALVGVLVALLEANGDEAGELALETLGAEKLSATLRIVRDLLEKADEALGLAPEARA
jgi:hypothetical protein